MITLEREQTSVLTQGNSGVEVQPQLEGVNPEVVVFQKRNAKGKRAEIVEYKKALVAEAWEKGWNKQLTERQSVVLERYRDPNSNGNGRILSLRSLAQRLKDSGDNITYETLSDHEIRAFRKLERFRKKEETKEILYLWIIEKMSPASIARCLQMDREETSELIRGADAQIKNAGQWPRSVTISDPDLAVLAIELLCNHVPKTRIARVLGVSRRTIYNRLKNQ